MVQIWTMLVQLDLSISIQMKSIFASNLNHVGSLLSISVQMKSIFASNLNHVGSFLSISIQMKSIFASDLNHVGSVRAINFNTNVVRIFFKFEPGWFTFLFFFFLAINSSHRFQMPLIWTAGHKLAVPVAMFPLLWNVSLGVYFLCLSYYDLTLSSLFCICHYFPLFLCSYVHNSPFIPGFS